MEVQKKLRQKYLSKQVHFYSGLRYLEATLILGRSLKFQPHTEVHFTSFLAFQYKSKQDIGTCTDVSFNN